MKGVEFCLLVGIRVETANLLIKLTAEFELGVNKRNCEGRKLSFSRCEERDYVSNAIYLLVYSFLLLPNTLANGNTVVIDHLLRMI